MMGHKHGKYQTQADLFGAAASVLDSLVSVQQGKLTQELEMHKVKVSQREAKLERLHEKELDKLDFLQQLYGTARQEFMQQKKDFGFLETLPVESETGKLMKERTMESYDDPAELENLIAMLDTARIAKETQISSYRMGQDMYQAVDSFNADGVSDGTATVDEVDAWIADQRIKSEKAGKTFMIDPRAFEYGVSKELMGWRERKEIASIEAGEKLTTAKVVTEGATQKEIDARARLLVAESAKLEHLTLGLPSVAQMEIRNDQAIDLADVKIQGAFVDVEAVRKNMELVGTQIALQNTEISKIAGEVAQTEYLKNKDQYEWTRNRLDAAMLLNNQYQGEVVTATTQILGYYDSDKQTWRPFLGILQSGREAVAFGNPDALQESFREIARNTKFKGAERKEGDFIGIGQNGELKRLFNAMYLSGVGDPEVTADIYRTLPPTEMIQAIAFIQTEYSPMKELETSVNKAFAGWYADKKTKLLNSGAINKPNWDKNYNKALTSGIISRQGNDFAKFLRSNASPLKGHDADTYFRYEQWKHTGFFDTANEHMINASIAVYNQKLANDGLIEKLVTRGAQYGMMETQEAFGDSVSIEPVSPIFPPIK